MKIRKTTKILFAKLFLFWILDLLFYVTLYMNVSDNIPLPNDIRMQIFKRNFQRPWILYFTFLTITKKYVSTFFKILTYITVGCPVVRVGQQLWNRNSTKIAFKEANKIEYQWSQIITINASKSICVIMKVCAKRNREDRINATWKCPDPRFITLLSCIPVARPPFPRVRPLIFFIGVSRIQRIVSTCYVIGQYRAGTRFESFSATHDPH